MSTSVPPRGSSVSSGALPDVQALKRVFDSDFKGLVDQAKSHLGNAASFANRVAEGSLVRAWDARGKLQTMDQLRSFLADDVKAAAARALARHTGGHPNQKAEAPAI